MQYIHGFFYYLTGFRRLTILSLCVSITALQWPLQAVSVSARPNLPFPPYCCDDQEMYTTLSVEALVWNSQLKGLDSLFKQQTIRENTSDGRVTTRVETERSKEHWHFAPGARVRAKAQFLSYEISGGWTHFDSVTRYRKGSRASLLNSPVILNPLDSQYGDWKVTHDMCQIFFSKQFQAWPCVFCRPYLGLTGFKLSQRIIAHLQTLFVDQNTDQETLFYEDVDEKERMTAFGPTFGFEANWKISDYVCLYAQWDMTPYIGQGRRRRENIDTKAVETLVTQDYSRFTTHELFTSAQYGLKAFKSVMCGTYDMLLELKVGWNQQTFYDALSLRSKGTVGFQGLSCGLSLEMRL